MATSSRALEERRQREYNATKNATELAELQRRWAQEDDATRYAADWRTAETRALKRRLAAVERVLGSDGKRLIQPLVGAVADVMRKVREEERAHVAKTIQEEFERRCTLDYQGIWSAEVDYQKGAVVTRDGSLFIATAPARKGVRPPGPSWQLAVKSQGKGPGYA